MQTRRDVDDDGEVDTILPTGLDDMRDAGKVQRVGDEPDHVYDEVDVEEWLDELADLLRQTGGIFGCARDSDPGREEQGTRRPAIASSLARAILPSEKGISSPPRRS